MTLKMQFIIPAWSEIQKIFLLLFQTPSWCFISDFLHFLSECEEQVASFPRVHVLPENKRSTAPSIEQHSFNPG